MVRALVLLGALLAMVLLVSMAAAQQRFSPRELSEAETVVRFRHSASLSARHAKRSIKRAAHSLVRSPLPLPSPVPSQLSRRPR